MQMSQRAKRTKAFLSQYSIRTNSKEKETKYLSLNNNYQQASAGNTSKIENKLSHAPTFNSPQISLNQNRHLSDIKRKPNKRVEDNKYFFLPAISKMRYLKQEIIDKLLEAPKPSNGPNTTDLNEENHKRKRKRNKDCKKKTQLAVELTSDITIEQEDNCLNQPSKLLIANVSKGKRASIFKKISTIDDGAITDQHRFSTVRRSSIIDRLAIKLINPEDCIEEYLDQVRPGDTFKRLQKQLLKQKDKITSLHLDIQKAQNSNKDSLKQYVTNLKKQKTIF